VVKTKRIAHSECTFPVQEHGAESGSPPRDLSTSSPSTPSMLEHLSILTVATPVLMVLSVCFGHRTMTSSLGAALAVKPRRTGIVLNHFFRISPPARIVADLSMRVRNDLNCGTCDSESNQQLNPESGLDVGEGGKLGTSSSRVLVVEDSEPFRKFVCSALGKRPELQIVGEASDGLEAVQKAEELQPDLIVLDIGLPSLNGIEVARRIRTLSRQSRILFVSQETSTDMVEAALATGARGYVLKTDAGRELLEAVDGVLRGDQFVSRRFSGHDFVGASDTEVSQEFRTKSAFAPLHQNMEIAHRHDVVFYSDDECFLDSFTRFVGAVLNAGNAVIVVATESHRESLLLKLHAHGFDIGAAIQQGRYIPLDAADTVSTFMVDDLPDPGKFLKVTRDLIAEAAKAVNFESVRVAVCGECAPLLWAQGNGEAAIRLEHLWDEIAKSHGLDVLCAYPLGSFQGGVGIRIFERICAEHSAVCSR
jgi:DNA-binding NarL/FixJ family response regulator